MYYQRNNSLIYSRSCLVLIQGIASKLIEKYEVGGSAEREIN